MNVGGNRKTCQDTIKDEGKVLIEKRVKYYWSRWRSLHPDLYEDDQELEKTTQDTITNLWFKRSQFVIKNALAVFEN